MSLAEFRQWLKYREKRGSLNLGMRIERGAATLATLYANVHSKNGGYKIYDFMPHDSEPALTLDQAKEAWV